MHTGFLWENLKERPLGRLGLRWWIIINESQRSVM
jgi:hypothetical protein